MTVNSVRGTLADPRIRPCYNRNTILLLLHLCIFLKIRAILIIPLARFRRNLKDNLHFRYDLQIINSSKMSQSRSIKLIMLLQQFADFHWITVPEALILQGTNENGDLGTQISLCPGQSG